MYKKLKEKCYRANIELPRLGLVIYTFGNVSVIDRKLGVFAIKPSGVDYAKMKADDMVVVDLEGKVVDGDLRPSTDVNTHLVLYREFPHVGGIVHTHSTYAVAWSQAQRPVPIYGTTHADHLACDIPCTEPVADDRIDEDYEIETGRRIVEHFTEHKLNPNEVQMVLTAGHGPFAWGVNEEKALYNARILEELCRMALLTEQINPQAQRLKESLIAKHYNRKHGKNAYYGQKN